MHLPADNVGVGKRGSSMTRGIIPANGVNLSYFRAGKGPPLMVVGWAQYHQMFPASLFQHFDMTFADCRYFVRSYQATPEELEAVDLNTFVDEVESVRSALGLGRITILGHSAQVQIALAYALKYPENTGRVVLVCGVPYGFAELAAAQEQYWSEYASDERKAAFERDQKKYATELQAASPERAFSVFYLANTAKYWADHENDHAQLVSQLITSPAFDRFFVSIPPKAEVRSRLERVSVPCLVIAAVHDYMCPPTEWRKLTAELPNITYRLLDTTGHNPQTEEPELFERELLKWFKEVGD